METNSEKRETEISRVLNNLERSTEILDKEVSEMEVRLSPIVLGANQKGTGLVSGTVPTGDYQTDLAQRVNNSVSTIESLNDRLRNLRNKIEL